jgi:putative transposase
MRLRDGRIRKLRKLSDVPGEAHKLTFSCYRRLKMLSRDRTRLWLIEALDAARHKHDFELWAYVIMPEHAHVLLYPRRAEYDTGAIRQLIKQPVGQKAINWLKSNDPAWLNELRKISADGRVHHHFWQPGGGYDRSIVKPETAWAAVEYIHNNPVRRGLVEGPTDWAWSSARWYVGEEHVVLEMDDVPPASPGY